MPTSLHRAAVACAAIMAAYGDDSSRSALTIIPPAGAGTHVSIRSCSRTLSQATRTSDTSDGLLSSQISDVNKGIVERGKDAVEGEFQSEDVA